MTIQRKIFRGVGAVVVSIKGKTKCGILTILHVQQQMDFSKLPLEIDLNLSPDEANAGNCAWDAVIVDDRGVYKDGTPLPPVFDTATLTEYGVTTIGPEWPRGASFGGVYLENSFFVSKFKEHIEVSPSQPLCTWPSDNYRTYELMTVAYSKSPANGPRRSLRYGGVRARIQGMSAGGKALVNIFRAGSDESLGIHELDLDNPAAIDLTVPPLDDLSLPPFDPKDPRQSLLENTLGSEGGVFIELGVLASLTPPVQRPGPKLPIGMG